MMVTTNIKPTKMVTRQSRMAHVKLTEKTRGLTYRNKHMLDLYQKIIRPIMLYGITTWRQTNQNDQEAREVQRRVMNMREHLKKGSLT